MILVALATVFALPMSAQSDAEPILVDGCRPLLAPDCVIDDMVDEVKAVDDYKHPDYDAVLDGDLDNCAEMPFTVAQAGLLYNPIITIEGGTCWVPIAVFNIENTTTNLKKLVIQQNTNGKSENTVITISI